MSMGLPVCGFLDDLSAARGGDLDALGACSSGFASICWSLPTESSTTTCGSSAAHRTWCRIRSARYTAGSVSSEGRPRKTYERGCAAPLLNNLHDLTRHYVGTRKRDLRDEIPIEASPRETLIDSGLTPGAHLVAAEETARLERALQRLPEDYRRVIDLRFRRELPFDTIGDIMNRSKDSARMLLFRAVERLQGDLGVVHDDAARSRRE